MAGAQVVVAPATCSDSGGRKNPRNTTWVWVKYRVSPKWIPGKWKHGQPAVPWWFNFDPYPHLDSLLSEAPNVGPNCSDGVKRKPTKAMAQASHAFCNGHIPSLQPPRNMSARSAARSSSTLLLSCMARLSRCNEHPGSNSSPLETPSTALWTTRPSDKLICPAEFWTLAGLSGLVEQLAISLVAVDGLSQAYRVSLILTKMYDKLRRGGAE